jgi:predicted Mrr-cat superfamily restriction endonuclease
LDIAVAEEEWKLQCLRSDLGRSYQREVAANRNFVRETSVGDFIVLPRPGEGVCYIGRVDSPFWDSK